jgi:hypothetical protein
MIFGAAAMLGVSKSAPAQTTSPRRLGFLTGGLPDVPAPNLAHLVEALAALGWTEGCDFVVLARGGAGRVENYRAVVAELIVEGADLLIVHGTAELSAAQSVAATLPIVFIDVPDPIRARQTARKKTPALVRPAS